MSCYKITAIISHDCLQAVEKALMRLHVRGISVSEVSGYGEYHNFYRRNTMCQHVKIEIFCLSPEKQAGLACLWCLFSLRDCAVYGNVRVSIKNAAGRKTGEWGMIWLTVLLMNISTTLRCIE